MSKKFKDVEKGDKIWVMDSEADLCEYQVQSINIYGLSVKIIFDNDNYLISVKKEESTSMANLVSGTDSVLVYISTNKNELIDRYIDKLEQLIDNSRKVVDEGLASIENMQNKLVKVKLQYD